MSPVNKKLSIATLVTILLTVFSLLGNYYLFYKAKSLYREINLLRQDPMEVGKINTSSFNALEPGKKRLFVLGDSRAKQWVTPPGLEKIRFINVGIGGQTSAQVLGRYDYHIKPHRPDYLLVQVGINDIKAIGLSLLSAESVLMQYKKNIESLVIKAQQDRIRVILTTIFPTAEISLVRSMFWSQSATDAVKEMNSYIKSIDIENVQVFDAAKILSSEDGDLKEDFATDFLHLSDAGYKALNQALVLPR